MFIAEPLSLTLASLIVFLLIYFKFQIVVFQQLIAFLIVLLVVLTRFPFVLTGNIFSKLLRLSLIALSGLLVQLLVISSGGFYSPFLILLYFYTLGASFLLNLHTAISFLVLSLILLVAATFFDQRMKMLFEEDPGSAILYFVSFIVIIPLAQFLMRTYHLKSVLSKILAEYVQIGQKREESILRGLSEVVLVTDGSLRILSVNEATERVVGKSQREFYGQPLLTTVLLRDENGNLATAKTLSIDSILTDKVSRIIKGFYFFTNDGRSSQVLIQARPITDSENKTKQIVFVITEALATSGYGGQHSDLDKTLLKYKTTITDIKKALNLVNSKTLVKRIEVLAHIEEDLITALEVEDHSVKEKISYEDMVFLLKQIFLDKKEFAQMLDVNLQLLIPEDAQEVALISLREQNIPQQILAESNFAVLIDTRWVRLLIQKLIDMAVLLSSGKEDARVELSVGTENKSSVFVSIVASCSIKEDQKQHLFLKYYGELESQTNLKFGSGLEGFLAKTIADKLNIPIVVTIDKSSSSLNFILRLTRKPQGKAVLT